MSALTIGNLPANCCARVLVPDREADGTYLILKIPVHLLKRSISLTVLLRLTCKSHNMAFY